MRTSVRNIGQWTLTQYLYAKKMTLSLEFALNFVIQSAANYEPSQIDELITAIEEHRKESHQLLRFQDTLVVTKKIGARVWYTGEIDHYQICFKEKKSGRVIFTLRQPIGTAR